MSIAHARIPAARLATDVIGQCASDALWEELALFPKPGLVSPFDCGAHDDMDVGTFERSLGAIEGYFPAIAAAGADGAPFDELRRLGIAAETAMLAATNGVNTHRGAIFSLGLLAAGAGHLIAAGRSLHADAIGRAVSRLWGPTILAAAPQASSHGLRVVARYGVSGARRAAADGFPILFDRALPVLREHLSDERGHAAARVQTLFTLIAELDDTNLLHRGGTDGLAFAKAQARSFLMRGGVDAADWHESACAVHRRFVARRLSPGGAADMLAAACFLLRLQALFA